MRLNQKRGYFPAYSKYVSSCAYGGEQQHKKLKASRAVI